MALGVALSVQSSACCEGSCSCSNSFTATPAHLLCAPLRLQLPQVQVSLRFGLCGCGRGLVVRVCPSIVHHHSLHAQYAPLPPAPCTPGTHACPHHAHLGVCHLLGIVCEHADELGVLEGLGELVRLLRGWAGAWGERLRRCKGCRTACVGEQLQRGQQCGRGHVRPCASST